MKKLFGKIAVARGFITEQQLQEILLQFGREHSVDDARQRRLGDLAVDMGFMSHDEVGEALLLQQALLQETAGDGEELQIPDEILDAVRPGRKVLAQMVASAVKARASDLHLHAGVAPFIRRAGKLMRGGGPAPDSGALAAELKDLLNEDQLAELETQGQVDLCVPYRNGYRLRTNVFYERNGLCASIRVVPPIIPTLDRLHLPSAAAALTTFPQGLVLVSGPAGSGKTTTLASLVQLINSERRDHILCIEDPIEYVYEPDQCAITQRELSLHTADSSSALRAALREDPDVIVIGELRDATSISLALTAAETGHLVIATLHTSSCVGTVARILDAFSGAKEAQVRAMLGESLRGILSQKLVPGAKGGVVPVVELMFNTLAMGNCIRERKLHQIPSLIQTGRNKNMLTRELSAKDLLSRGLIDKETFDRVLAAEEA